MDNNAIQCEKTFYKELYHFGSGKCSVVMDTVSGRIWLRKRLAVYDTAVFQYIKEHPDRHIPGINSFYMDGDALTVIEELISGYSLEYLLANQLLTDVQKKDIVIQICEGLEFLHHAHPAIIHRDIKASNIIVTDDGVVKIIDYDAAKQFNARQKKDTILIGTAGCAAPEQYGFGKCDERTDIYGLGMLIKLMFPDDPQMNRIAQKAARLEPEHRYQNVRQIKRAISGTDSRSVFPAILRCLKKIPGLRSDKPWKRLLALTGYFIIFYYALTFQVSPPAEKFSGYELWCNRLCILGLELSLIALFSSESRLYIKLPLFRKHIRLQQAVSYILETLVTIFSWGLICTIAVAIVS